MIQDYRDMDPLKLYKALNNVMIANPLKCVY